MPKTPEAYVLLRDRLSALGLSDEAVAGVVANVAHESGGNPKAVGDGGSSIGLAQWHDDRADALMRWADRRELNPSHAATQVDFLVHELRNAYPRVLDQLRTAKTAGEAAAIFTHGFEQPADAEVKAAERAGTAGDVLGWIQRTTGRVPMGGGSPTAIQAGPTEQPESLLGAVGRGAREGFGDQPIGLGAEAGAFVDRLGIAGPAIRGLAVGADVLGRGIGAVTGAGAAALGNVAQQLGETETGSRQLERDARQMADLGMVAAPLASPTGLVTPRAIMSRETPPSPEALGRPSARPGLPIPAAPEMAPVRPPKPPAAVLRPEAIARVKAGEAVDISKPATIPNLARITSTDEAKNLITETAEIYRGSIDEARRGVLSHEATRQLADQIAVTPDELARGWKQGGVLNAEQMLAARDTLVTSAEQIMLKAREAQERGGAANSELFDLLNRHRATQEAVQGYTAEAGRLLNQFNIMSKDGRARIVDEALTASGGQWEEIVRRLAAANPDEIPSLVRDLPGATNMDRLHLAWINGLLSSPTTHAANILGNTGSMLSGFIETAVSEAFGRVGRAVGVKGGVRGGETVAELGGAVRGTVEGFSAAWDALRRGTIGPGKAEVGRLRAGLKAAAETPGKLNDGGLAKMLLPTRWLGAEDAFFKSIAYRAKIGSMAVRQARDEGLKGDAFKARVRALGRAPSEGMKAAAEKGADYATFQQELGKAGKAMQAARRDIPGGKWIVPFMRTPVNLMKFAAERSPLGAIRLVAPGKFGLETAAQKQMALARATVGTGIGLIAADLADQGVITGGGPADAGERGVWLEDHQPYSVNVGGQWISYNRLDPLSMQIGAVADFVDLAKRAGTSDAELDKTAAQIVGGISRYLTSTTWLSGPVSWLMAFADPERYGSGPIEQLAGSVVPAAVGQAARMLDVNAQGENIARPAEGLWDAIAAKVPGLREDLPESVGVLGETITSKQAFGPLLPQKVKPAVTNPVAEAMRRAEYFPQRPSGKFTMGGTEYDLKGHDLAEFRRNVGTEFVKIAELVLQNPRWFQLPPEAQKQLLARAHSQAFEAGKAAYWKRVTQPQRDALRERQQREEQDAVERAEKDRAKIMKRNPDADVVVFPDSGGDRLVGPDAPQ